MPQELQPFRSYCLCIPHWGCVLRKLVWKTTTTVFKFGNFEAKIWHKPIWLGDGVPCQPKFFHSFSFSKLCIPFDWVTPFSPPSLSTSESCRGKCVLGGGGGTTHASAILILASWSLWSGMLRLSQGWCEQVVSGIYQLNPRRTQWVKSPMNSFENS